MKSLIVVLAILLPASSWALTGSVTGAVVTVEYDEPIVNAVNSDGVELPLDDLGHTTIYYQANNGGVVIAAEVPATSVNGGGHIVKEVTLPTVERNVYTVNIWATASDKEVPPNESEKSNTVTVRLDRLAPGAPK